MGYRTCYYRTFNVGRAMPVPQHDAYKKAREWLDKAIALIKPGVSTDKVCSVCRRRRSSGFLTRCRRSAWCSATASAGAARAAHHLAGDLAHPSDRDQGRHGVRP
jgi:hypothetical protein